MDGAVLGVLRQLPNGATLADLSTMFGHRDQIAASISRLVGRGEVVVAGQRKRSTVYRATGR